MTTGTKFIVGGLFLVALGGTLYFWLGREDFADDETDDKTDDGTTTTTSGGGGGTGYQGGPVSGGSPTTNVCSSN